MSDIDKTSQFKTKTRRLRWWHIVLVFLLLLAIAVLMVWNNRYALMEDQAVKWLKSQGYDAELRVASVSKTSANVKHIKISKDGQQILTASALDVEYVFKEALDGRFRRITIKQPELTVRIDKKGNLVDDWLPQSGGAGGAPSAGVELPLGGVRIEDAKVNWSAPFGGGAAMITADIASKNEWDLDVDAPDMVLTNGRDSLEFDLKAVLFSDGPDAFTVSGRMDTADAAFPALSIKALGNDFKFKVTRDNAGIIGVDGFTFAQIEEARIAGVSIEHNSTRFDVETRYNPESTTIVAMKADWEIDAKSTALIDPARRRALAKMLTVEDAILIAPIGKHFIGDITDRASALLGGADVNGRGQFLLTQDGYQISLNTPLIAKSSTQRLELRTLKDLSFLSYDKTANILQMRADIDWRSPRSLSAYGLKADMVSQTGIDIVGVQTLSAMIESTSTWRETVEGVKANLAPLRLALSYRQSEKQRHVKVAGKIDYDGPIPGGDVVGLRAGGTLNMTLRGNDFTLNYTPIGTVQMQRFENASGWTASAIALTVSSGQNLLARKGKDQPFAIDLADISADLTAPENDRHLQLTAASANIRSDFAQEPQVWDIAFADANITSDDFPAPGTNIKSRSGTLDVTMPKAGNFSFDLNSPKTSVETEAIRMSTLAVTANGTPSDMGFTFDTSRVLFKGADGPVLPARGEGRFADGVLSGQAVSALPKTKNMPINIDFRSQAGVGTAKVRIDRLAFTPAGLQPQDLVPTLKGKVAEVRGIVKANIDIAFGGGVPMQSSGNVALLGLDVGTLVGPFTGIETSLDFSSIFPMKTDGVQTAMIGGFDPGFPMKNGEIVFEIVPEGVRIDKAQWPVLATENNGSIGTIEILPTNWRFGNVENRLTVRIEDLSLGAVVNAIGKDKIYASGQITGELPVIVNGVNVIVDNGVMRVKDGGVIRYSSAHTEALIREGAKTDQEAFQKSDYPGLAFRALQDFHYNELEARLNGPLDGEMALRFAFDGANTEVLSGQPFAFDLNFKGELANLARNLAKSFSNQERMKEILELGGSKPQIPK